MEKDNSVRKKKVEATLQGIIARFFTVESTEWHLGAMVMVDQIFVSPDLKNAQVWVSFSPHKPEVAEKIFVKVLAHLRELQDYVFQTMEIRRVPRLSLHLADPTKTFKVIDLFDTLEGDRKPSQSDTSDIDGQQSDTAGDA